MLFWIMLIVLAVSIIWYINDDCNLVAFILFLFSVIANIISAICLMYCNIGVDGYIAANNARYDSLVYQYENSIYDNDNDLGKRELMVDIQAWNEDLAKYRENQDDFWIGFYIPDIYDQFEFIELE